MPPRTAAWVLGRDESYPIPAHIGLRAMLEAPSGGRLEAGVRKQLTVRRTSASVSTLSLFGPQ